MTYKTLRERVEEQQVSHNDLSQKEIDKKLEDTLQNLKELRDESALYSTSNLMRELQIIRNGYVKENNDMGKIHSVAICKKETFEQWKRGELLCFDGVLLSPIDRVSSTTKVAAKKLYIKNQDEFQKDWADLSNEAKEKCYVQYVMKHDTSYCENGETYEEYMNGDLDSYEMEYTSESGDELVVFGRYGTTDSGILNRQMDAFRLNSIVD